MEHSARGGVEQPLGTHAGAGFEAVQVTQEGDRVKAQQVLYQLLQRAHVTHDLLRARCERVPDGIQLPAAPPTPRQSTNQQSNCPSWLRCRQCVDGQCGDVV